MNLQEAYELRRQEVLSLQRQNKKLQKELEQVEAGLFTPEEKTSLHKQIIKLARTLADTEKEETVTTTCGTEKESATLPVSLQGWMPKRRTGY